MTGIILRGKYCTGCGYRSHNDQLRRCCPDENPVHADEYIEYLEATINRMSPVIIAALQTVTKKSWNTEAAAMNLTPAVDAYREACHGI